MDLQSVILSAVSFVLGIGVVWPRAEKVLNALRELGDVLTVLTKSFDDKKLSPEEWASVRKELGEALAAFRAILK